MNDGQFWRLIETLSEPPGGFTLSENFVSNEPTFADRVRMLSPAGGVYVGVGPEQNFSYIAGLRPAMAFVVDIRRENRNLQLLYKALFELSHDRADFVSRLFSRPRPAALGSASTVDEIFTRYASVAPSQELFTQTQVLVREGLVAGHGFPLSAVDLEDIDRALEAFSADGPDIDFWGGQPGGTVRPSYRQLMIARDITGRSRSYLATEEGFGFVKELQARNLIVPVIGDFAGHGAIRGVGDYVRRHSGAVRAFYASNVAVYLTNQQMSAFCRNLATLPAAPRALFLESNGMRSLTSRLHACADR